MRGAGFAGAPDSEGRSWHVRRTGALCSRLCWTLLVAGIALVTVTVPALILPRSDPRPPAPQAAASTGGLASPSPSHVATPPSSATRSGPPPTPATKCGTATDAVQAGQPSCHAYDTVLGNGWQVSGTGAKVLTGERIPGSTQLALRVEPQQQTAWVTLIPATPVVTHGHGKLLVTVYGGRLRGTSLRLSAAGPGPADPSRAVVLTAPPDQWTLFTADLTQLLPADSSVVRRIDFALAYDLNPNLSRFFLDRVTLVA